MNSCFNNYDSRKRLQAELEKEIKQSEPHPLLLSLVEASKELGVSSRTLHKLKQDGTIPHVRIGHRVLFSIDSLRGFIQQNEQRGVK